MCAIIGSFDTEKLLELARLNMYRGSTSYSFSLYYPEYRNIIVMRSAQPFEPDDPRYIKIDKGAYGIMHIQAPTSDIEQTIDNVHPAQIAEYGHYCDWRYYLWHNGILKQHYVEQLKKDLEVNSNWDTKLLLHLIVNKGMEALSEVDGTFSCLLVLAGDGLYLFRNQLSPLFIDDQCNISSTKFEGARTLPPEVVFKFNVEYHDPLYPYLQLTSILKFKTKNNPYYFGDLKHSKIISKGDGT